MSNEPSANAAPAVDDRNPWLGLASFTEETRGYFYGREDEVGELARRVQRKLLTVLFGQSGLGKTSILRAGLVPRLRAQGFCPVYVRIAYGHDAPEPAEQIKQAIALTARRSGTWTQVGVAVEGESLWEFLHHRGDLLVDEAGATQVPLIIFDQFEEIFTLAQTDDFGRARAARFIADLADLVENRPPKALEARLESDEAAAEQFDFARSDYRVLIALREDYLAPLEGLKTSMPSITQNRLRLAPMTGKQALSAVMLPGKKLVSEEVAEAIVRFVAGGAEIANAEVEPSLLSLICRELNDTRTAAGRSEISLDLLAGSHASILSNFYERSLADQAPAVRRIIEDELLTESGYRENVAEERLRSDLAAAGAGPETLAMLVNRRLLRIEERLDIRRVELTHDVLCPVVRASRDVRKEREARDATERLLADQKAREQAARSALVRARQVASACIVLALLAVAAAGYAYLSSQRARHAELQAQATRAAAERARTEAEHLLGYLNDDFATELEGFGRLGLVMDLGQRELDYYRSLPAALQTSDTVRSRALAEVRYGLALQLQARLPESEKMLTGAIATLRQLRAAGDTSERTAIGLSMGLGALADVHDRSGRKDARELATESVAILTPYYDKPRASAAVRRAYGLMVGSLGTYQDADGGKSLERAREAFASLGAKDLSDVQAAADYAQATALQCRDAFFEGDDARLKPLAMEAELIAARVLEIRPGHLVALRAHNVALAYLSTPALNEMRLAESRGLVERATADAATLVRLDPTNFDDRWTLAFDYGIEGRSQLDAGHPAAAITKLRQAIATVDGAAKPGLIGLNQALRDALDVEMVETDRGNTVGRAARLADIEARLARIRQAQAADSPLRINANAISTLSRARLAFLMGDLKEAHALALAAAEQLSHTVAFNSGLADALRARRVEADLLRADIEYTLEDYTASAASARSAIEHQSSLRAQRIDDKLAANRPPVAAAMALARLGKTAEAATILGPTLRLERDLYARNHDYERQRLDYATALYAHALAEPAARAASLNEANRILHALPAEMQALTSVKRWQQRVGAELSAHSRPD